MAKVKLLKPNAVRIETNLTLKDVQIAYALNPDVLNNYDTSEKNPKKIFTLAVGSDSVVTKSLVRFIKPAKKEDKLVLTSETPFAQLAGDDLIVTKANAAFVQEQLKAIETRVAEVLKSTEAAVKAIEVE